MDGVTGQSLFFPGERHGIILHGELFYSSAKLLQRKDGSGAVVKLTYELIVGQSFANVEEFVDPAHDDRVTVKNGEVVKWPDVPRFAHVEYLVERFKTEDGKMMIATKGRFTRIIENPDATRFMASPS
jgi:hypothetical protein